MYEKQYDYDYCSVIKYLANQTLITLEYNDETARCSADLRVVLDTLLNEGRLVVKKENIFNETFTDVHITFTNKKIEQINKSFKPDGQMGCGDRIISNSNLKEHDICRSMFFTIQSMNDEETVIQKEELGEATKTITITTADLRKHFALNYATTVHKMQGSEIRKLFVIHEANLMSKRLLYTALSRARELSDILIKNMEWVDMGDGYFTARKIYKNDVITDDASLEILNNALEKDENKYKSGKIYLVRDNEHHVIYVGQTIRTIEKEFKCLCSFTTDKDRRDIKRYLQKYKDECKVELVKEFPCETLYELTQEETRWINHYNSEYLLNIRQVKNKKSLKVKTEIHTTNIEKKLKHMFKVFEEPSRSRFRVYSQETKKRDNYNYKKEGREATLNEIRRIYGEENLIYNFKEEEEEEKAENL
jgi:hypothetical protein